MVNPAVLRVIASAVDQPQEIQRVSIDDPTPTLVLVSKVESVLAESRLSEERRKSAARRGLIALVVGAIMVAVDGLLPGHTTVGLPAEADAELDESLRIFISGLVASRS